MTVRNFPILNDGWYVSATTTSTVVLLETPAFDYGYNDDILIFNPGPYTVHARTGDETVVATNASMPIVAGEKGVYRKGKSTHLAVYCEDGDQGCWVFIGEGS